MEASGNQKIVLIVSYKNVYKIFMFFLAAQKTFILGKADKRLTPRTKQGAKKCGYNDTAPNIYIIFYLIYNITTLHIIFSLPLQSHDTLC